MFKWFKNIIQSLLKFWQVEAKLVLINKFSLSIVQNIPFDSFAKHPAAKFTTAKRSLNPYFAHHFTLSSIWCQYFVPQKDEKLPQTTCFRRGIFSCPTPPLANAINGLGGFGKFSFFDPRGPGWLINDSSETFQSSFLLLLLMMGFDDGNWILFVKSLWFMHLIDKFYLVYELFHQLVVFFWGAWCDVMMGRCSLEVVLHFN